MKCPWQSDIALAAGGDLPEGAVGGHLAACAECAALYNDLLLVCAELGGVAPGMSVHAEVMARVRLRSRPRWHWHVAAAAGLLIGLFAVTLKLREQRPQPTISLVQPEAPALEFTKTAAVQPVKRRHADKPKRSAEAAVVKLVTDDPNIVIYLVAD